MHTCAASLLKYAAMSLLGPRLLILFGQRSVFTSWRCSLIRSSRWLGRGFLAWTRFSALIHSILSAQLDASRRNAPWRMRRERSATLLKPRSLLVTINIGCSAITGAQRLRLVTSARACLAAVKCRRRWD